jgi:type VI protein secretion system component Hcp
MRKRGAVKIAAPILILATCFLFGRAARAQSSGYLRAVTAAHGEITGESTDPAHKGWIPLRQVTVPSASQMAAMRVEETSDQGQAAMKVVHPPIVVVKDRDGSSLALLGAFTSKQRFPEMDLDVTNFSDQPVGRYRLIDATIIAMRASDPVDPNHQPVEVVKITYARIERRE